MNTQEEYRKIMEVISDKTLSRGLLGVRSTTEPCEYNGGFWESYGIGVADVNVKIIGHPIHIGDVLDWWDKNINQFDSRLMELFTLWGDKRLPLSPTDEELVDYIYTLVSSYQH